MSSIAKIQDFAQECADNIAKIAGLDVSIIDENNIRISGTGFHRQLIGKRVPSGSFFETILKTGKPGMIFDRRENGDKCSNCIFNEQCTELATIGFPIYKNRRAIGVIGFIGFTPTQRKMIVEHSSSLSNFLQNISSLLENKLMLQEINEPEDCLVHEAENYKKPYTFDSIIGTNEKLLAIIKKAKKIADSPSTVLIRGENGTGKEMLAQAIHYNSKRAKHPFISVNCGAIPEQLIESELFGYEGGAFTGANRNGKPGKFELAGSGTIFLDEIGDLPLSVQPKLLRVLQEKCFEKVGGNQLLPVHARVMAATNKNLEKMVKEGRFREDLYYRINVLPFTMIPLRERLNDIPMLLSHFINKYSILLNRQVPEINVWLEQWLMNYDWPGNIRQLENVVEYMINMNESGLLDFDDLPDDMQLEAEKYCNRERGTTSLTELLSQYERNILVKFVPKNAASIEKAEAAKKLNISLATLYRKLEKYELQ